MRYTQIQYGHKRFQNARWGISDGYPHTPPVTSFNGGKITLSIIITYIIVVVKKGCTVVSI